MQWFELDEFIKERYFDPLEKCISEVFDIDCPQDVTEIILNYQMNVIHEDYINCSINNIISPQYNDYIFQTFDFLKSLTSFIIITGYTINNIVFEPDEYKPWITTLIAICVTIFVITMIIHFICILKVYFNSQKYETLFNITDTWENDNDSKLKNQGQGIFKYQTQFNNLILYNFGKWFNVLSIKEIQCSNYKKYKLPSEEIIHILYFKYIWPCITLVICCQSLKESIQSIILLSCLSGLWKLFFTTDKYKKTMKFFFVLFILLEIWFILTTIIRHFNAYYNNWMYENNNTANIWFMVVFLLPVGLWFFGLIQQKLHMKIINMNQEQYGELFQGSEVDIFSWMYYVLSTLFISNKMFKIFDDKPHTD